MVEAATAAVPERRAEAVASPVVWPEAVVDPAKAATPGTDRLALVVPVAPAEPDTTGSPPTAPVVDAVAEVEPETSVKAVGWPPAPADAALVPTRLAASTLEAEPAALVLPETTGGAFRLADADAVALAVPVRSGRSPDERGTATADAGLSA